jgi:hypothetical protein
VNDDELEWICRNQSWPNFKVLFQNLPGGSEENHENLNQDSRSLGPRIEPGTLQLQSRSFNYSTTTFCPMPY